MRAPRRLGTGATALLRVAAVALATHAALYRSLMPSGGAHRYLGWYEPVVAGLSVLALLAALVVLLARVSGVGGSFARHIVLESRASESVAVATSRLAAKAIAFLIVQETLERSIPSRSLEVAQFSPVDWLVILGATALMALVLVSAGRGCQLLVQRLRALHRPGRAAATSLGARPRAIAAAVAGNPLASFRGLRAPPSSMRL